jgi:murein L,D-transpeptidase YafK
MPRKIKRLILKTLFAILNSNMFFMKRISCRMVLRKSLLVAFIVILAGNFCPGFLKDREASATLGTADKVVVIKSKRLLMLLKEGDILKIYRVSLGKHPNGHKKKAGDKRTPEGRYILDSRNPESKFHLALRISYPNESDIRNAEKIGVRPGGDIMIHGLSDKMKKLGKLHRTSDWTDGCIAVTNSEIEEIWRLVPDGTPIEIKP